MGRRTVAVTGGSGFIGRAVVADLAENGYRVANLDRERGGGADEFRRTDLLSAGEVYGSLAAANADAVVHLGTIPDPLSDPGHVVYESNVMTSYNVLEAAAALGIKSVCLASSINAVGWTFQDPPPDIRYLPVDEDHPATPREPYGLAKRILEVTADGFGRAEGPPRTVSSLRFTTVVDDEQIRSRYAEADRSLPALREEFEKPGREVFDYVHVADAASLARRAIEAGYEGHETFWAAAADTSAGITTERLVDEFHPDVETRTGFEGHESLISTAKAQRMLGWEPTRSWRDI